MSPNPTAPAAGWARRPWTPWLAALIALALASAVRHWIVEPPAFAHACDPAPWAGWCAARSLVLRSFINAEIGWFALAAGVAAALTRWRGLAQVALVAGCAGLVLYSYEPAAVGGLLGVLVLARAAAPAPRR
ncbi:MAG TPA: hypothetical protein VM491_00120 [Burkholderiaceae bacterium]|nr:hypothetical protein [Burkholderiaceae bacterium]